MCLNDFILMYISVDDPFSRTSYFLIYILNTIEIKVHTRETMAIRSSKQHFILISET